MHKNKKVLVWSTIAVIAMFGFGYGLVPIYNVLCQALGINGKTSAEKQVNSATVDKSRLIRVQFLSTNNANLPWTFRPNTKQVELHPGQNVKITYYAKNNSNKTMTVQAVPSVTPGLAAGHVKKTECFCFRKQTLGAHKSMDMPVIFHLDNTLPNNIHEITLSYTLFKVKSV